MIELRRNARADLRVRSLTTIVAVLMLVEVAVLSLGGKTLRLASLELVIVVRSRHRHATVRIDMVHLASTSRGQILSSVHLSRLLKYLTVVVDLTARLRRHAQATAISTSHVLVSLSMLNSR